MRKRKTLIEVIMKSSSNTSGGILIKTEGRIHPFDLEFWSRFTFTSSTHDVCVCAYGSPLSEVKAREIALKCKNGTLAMRTFTDEMNRLNSIPWEKR